MGSHSSPFELDPFLKLFEKYKPYSVPWNDRSSRWKPLLEEYNSLVKQPYTSYQNLRAPFEKLVQQFNNGNTAFIRHEDRKLFQRISREYEKGCSARTTKSLNLVLELMNIYKPHIETTSDGSINKWRQLMNDYNKTKGTLFDNASSFRELFLRTMKRYKRHESLDNKLNDISTLKCLVDEYDNRFLPSKDKTVHTLLELVDKYKVLLKPLKTKGVYWNKILDEYNSVMGTNLKDYRSVSNKFDRIIKKYKSGKKICSEEIDTTFMDRLVEEHGSKATQNHQISLNLLIDLIDKHKPYLKFHEDWFSCWNDILEECNSILGTSMKDSKLIRHRFTELRKLVKEGKEFTLDCKKPYLIKLFVEEYNKAHQKWDSDSLDTLISLVNTYKPHLHAGGTIPVWNQIVDKYNLVMGTNFKGYKAIKPKFERALQIYMSNQTLPDCTNIDLFKLVAQEYDILPLRHQNVSYDTLILLVDMFKPHLFKFGPHEDTWPNVVREYNKIIGTDYQDANILQRKFADLQRTYKTGGHLSIKCNDPLLLGKLIKERDESKEQFDHEHLQLLLKLVNKYQPHLALKAAEMVNMWTVTTAEFNSIAGTHYKGYHTLRTRFNDLTKGYNIGLESSINCEDHVLLKKLVNESNTINEVERIPEVSLEIYLKLLYKYKPYAMRKNQVKRTWILLIDEYNRKMNTNYHSVPPFQRKLNAILKEYNTNGYSVKCQDQELLEKVMRDYNKLCIFPRPKVVQDSKESSVNSVEISAAAYEEDNSAQNSDGFSSPIESDDHDDILAVQPKMLH